MMEPYDTGIELESEDTSAWSLEIDVLSAAAWSQNAVALVMEELEPDDFALPSHRAAFKTMQNMYEAGEAVDKSTLRGRVDQTLWLGLEPVLGTNLDSHIARLREMSKVRYLRGLGLQLAEAPGDGSVLTSILDDGIAKLVRRERMRGTDLSTALMSIKDAKKEGLVAKASVDFPWSKVNQCTRGLRPGWLCYLAGRPGQGKTAAAIELAVSAAKQGKKVLIDSLEMDSEELAVRVAQRMGMDSEAFYMGEMSDHDWRALDHAIQHPAYRNVQIEYASTVAKLTALVRAHKPDLIIIDYVQLMDHRHEQRTEGTTQTSNALKRLARKYKVPVVALSQLSRPLKDQRGNLPDMADLRDSGALEQDADQIIFVWREEDKQHHIPTPKGMFIVAKARMGKPGKQVFNFDGPKQTFLLVDASA